MDQPPEATQPVPIPKRKYTSHTTQCEYIKRDGTQCTKQARKQYCCHHNPETLQKNRTAALNTYYKKKSQ